MSAPTYKCSECGARVIYDEKKNFWKCEKCGQQLSESDVFIQGLEEWKAENVKAKAKAVEATAKPRPKVKYQLSDDYVQKSKEKRDVFLFSKIIPDLQ